MSCTSLVTIEFTAGDTGTLLSFDDDSDLTGFTVRLRVDRPSPSAALIKAITSVSDPLNGQITDPTNGIGSFIFVASDLVEGDQQPATLEFQNATGKIENTERFYFDIAEHIE